MISILRKCTLGNVTSDEIAMGIRVKNEIVKLTWKELKRVRMDGNGNELDLSARPLSRSRGAAGADFEVKGELWIPHRRCSPTCGTKIPRRTEKNCFDRSKGMLASHPNYGERKLFEDCVSGTLSRIRPGEPQLELGEGRTPGRIIQLMSLVATLLL